MEILKIIVLFFYSVAVFSETQINTCTSGSDITIIYFVNGVWNEYDEAEDTSLELEKAYKPQLQSQYPNQTFEFKLAYNYSSGKVADVIELIGQKINEINDPEVSQTTAAEYFNMYLSVKNIKEKIPVAGYSILDVIEGYLAGRVSNAVDSDAHVTKYHTDLQEGRRVLLIAHSQGNMFANQLHL